MTRMPLFHQRYSLRNITLQQRAKLAVDLKKPCHFDWTEHRAKFRDEAFLSIETRLLNRDYLVEFRVCIVLGQVGIAEVFQFPQMTIVDLFHLGFVLIVQWPKFLGLIRSEIQQL